MTLNLGPVGKALVALYTFAAGWLMLVAQSPDGFSHISAGQWILAVTGAATALGVYGTPGTLFGKASKVITAVVTGLIGWIVMVVHSGPAAITPTEWVALTIVLGTAFGVYQVSNSPSSQPAPPAV